MAIAVFENDRFRWWSSIDDLLVGHAEMRANVTLTEPTQAGATLNRWTPLILGNRTGDNFAYIAADNESPLPNENYFIPDGAAVTREDGLTWDTHTNCILVDEIPRSIEAFEMRLSIRARVAGEGLGTPRRLHELGIFDMRDVADPITAEAARGEYVAQGGILLGVMPFGCSEIGAPGDTETLRFDQVVRLRRNAAIGLYIRCTRSVDGAGALENANRGVYFQLEHLMLRRP